MKMFLQTMAIFVTFTSWIAKGVIRMIYWSLKLIFQKEKLEEEGQRILNDTEHPERAQAQIDKLRKWAIWSIVIIVVIFMIFIKLTFYGS